MTMFENTFGDHVQAVERLAAAGITPPQEWSDLLNRYRTFQGMTGDAQRRLTQAILDGEDDDVDELHGFALIEAVASPQDRAAVNNVVEAAVSTRLMNLYEQSAKAAYVKAAAAFDKAAQQFEKCADLIDPCTDPEAVINLSDAQRKAWGEAPLAVNAVNAALDVLREAAWLCGVSAVTTDEVTIALTLNTEGVDRRELWAAWETVEGRCGRWAAIHTLGVPITANKTPDSLEPYRQPLPMEETWERVEGEIGYSRRMIDPEKVQEPTR
jgi:hypothetical protein